jgi:Fragile site-associated protein C-terminus
LEIAVEKFPSLERERERTSSGAGPQGHANATGKTPDYNHTAEVIFAFPSLQLHLKSEHLQSGRVPLLNGILTAINFNFIFKK